ncbi:MAG: YbaB/EbfC family nucleoid-associated protein, partial [Clostridia bacterium]|nr:YbaB/EbfC family nucleoid-associated protein [Clostridia bacterium]
RKANQDPEENPSGFLQVLSILPRDLPRVLPYTATSGGGMVEVTVTGKHQVTRLSIKPEIVDPDDIEMLEDLITAAVNEAMRTADSTGEEEMAKISSSLNIPNIPGMGGLF